MAGPNQNNVDLDALLDLTEYDTQFQSPNLTPSASSKPTFTSPLPVANGSPSNMNANAPTLSGPCHNYDMFQQQTGFVPGAIANTMAVNQTSNMGYQDFGSLDYLSTFNPDNELFDFNTSPSQHTVGISDMEMGNSTSPDSSQQFFPTVNPSKIEQTSSPSTAGRLWPGAHSHAAMMKAQQQQQQQQQQQNPQRQSQNQQAQPSRPRGKAANPTDPIVEQKITQLLNSMRAKTASSDSQDDSPLADMPRARKDDEDMDEDERLLASEEGKKLSSKERRQLRNKVSARAFRSRRKEYISQLESEIATKVNENGDLRAKNRALIDENKRLTDLTRMLLSSSSFSTFLDDMSSNPALIPAPPAQVKPEPQQQIQSQQQQQQQSQQRQLPKDVDPYGSHPSQQQIGMAMIPEQTLDFSMYAMDSNSFHFQPQVFVVDTPDVPTPIDTSTLSGKTSNFVEQSFELDNKLEMPLTVHTLGFEGPETEDLDNSEYDEELALYCSQPSSAPSTVEKPADAFLSVDLFGGIGPGKALARYDLVDPAEDEACAAMAMARVQQIAASLESTVSRLEQLTRGF